MTWREQQRDLRFAVGVLRRRPFQVLLQVTNRCNMQCDFCDFWPNGVAPREELTLTDFERIERDLSELGTFLVSIEGGEPFVRPDLVEIVALFARHHIPLLYTNGWYVDEAKARALWSAGLAQVGVSIDYATPERHDGRRRLAGAFTRAWRAVTTLRDTAAHAGKQVHVMTVLMRDNADELERAAHDVGPRARRALRDIAVDARLSPRRRCRHADSGPGRALRGALVRARRISGCSGTTCGRIATFLDGGQMPACHAGLQGFNIDHVGNVAAVHREDRSSVRQRSRRAALVDTPPHARGATRVADVRTAGRRAAASINR